MARVTTGPVISNIAGSAGAATFRNSAAGLVLSNRPLSTNRASPAQLEHRAIIQAAASAWSLLDADIKTAWSTLAKQETIPSFFARGRRWTGRQLFTCFFVQAETQLTPLPARWLPTPPIFWPVNSVRVLWFLPYYYTPPDPEFPDPPEGWYSLTSVTWWRPTSLNPPPPHYGVTDTAASVYYGYTPRNSTRPPRRWFRIVPFCGPPRPQPTLGGFLDAANGFSGGEHLVANTSGYPAGITDSMAAPISRVWDLWISISGLGNDRIYYLPEKNVGNAYSTAGDYVATDYVFNNPLYGPGTYSFINTEDNFPQTEV